MIYRNLFHPDCLPTEEVGVGGMTHAVPARSDLALAFKDGHQRLCAGYEIVCALLAEARMHLSHTLPDNWSEHPDMVAAVEYLGGADALEQLRQTESIDEASLP